MFQSDYPSFSEAMRDLCTAFNRPLNDDLVRVFWDALKPYPLPAVKGKVRFATMGKKFPTPVELRPESTITVEKKPTTQELLCDYVLRNRDLTDTQIRQPWLYTHDRAGNVTGVIVQADGENPGHRVTVSDLALDEVA